MAKTLGVIGCGKMGKALLEGIIARGLFAARDVCVFDVSPQRREEAAASGVNLATSNGALLESCEVVIVAVKPQVMEGLLGEIAPAAAGKLIISIAAGITTRFFEARLPLAARIIRAMPNTPALIGEGVTAITGGTRTSAADLALAQQIFEALGRVVVVEEGLLDVVTGLSGSGPAYALMVIEALADGGVLMGLPKGIALEMAAQTLAGAAKLLLKTGKHPGELKDMVTSPGGTTAAGLKALEKGGLRAALIAAVEAATLRSRELGKE